MGPAPINIQTLNLQVTNPAAPDVLAKLRQALGELVNAQPALSDI